MLLFVHLDISEVTLVKQVRPLARRQQALEKRKIPQVPCARDRRACSNRMDTGPWILFHLGQCCNYAHWGLISHLLAGCAGSFVASFLWV